MRHGKNGSKLIFCLVLVDDHHILLTAKPPSCNVCFEAKLNVLTVELEVQPERKGLVYSCQAFQGGYGNVAVSSLQ